MSRRTDEQTNGSATKVSFIKFALLLTQVPNLKFPTLEILKRIADRHTNVQNIYFRNSVTLLPGEMLAEQ